MEANKILSADVLDIIFDGKNKEYGAYQLRKAYKKTLTKALIITGSVLLLVLGANFFAKYMDDNDKKKFDTLETQMAELKADEPPPPPPPPPSPHWVPTTTTLRPAWDRLAACMLDLSFNGSIGFGTQRLQDPAPAHAHPGRPAKTLARRAG